MRFDIEDYKQRTSRLTWDDLDLKAAFAAKPLDEDSLRCIQYMHDVEFHTVCYLRDLLLTPAHDDPTVTAFLSFWAYEELWHGEALAEVLDAHGRAHGDARICELRKGLTRRSKLAPMATSAIGALVGSDFTAVHMTWGAINELTTQSGYARLTQLAGHPVLTTLLQRIMKQEGRHIDFYASQAEERLAASPRAQKMTRMALRRFWHPVGAGVMPETETGFLVKHLFSGDDGRATARRLDRRIDKFPGLADLHLIEGALDHTVSGESQGWLSIRRTFGLRERRTAAA